MDLKEFVSQTLLQIIQGVAEAQGQAAPLGAEVSPYVSNVKQGQEPVMYAGRGRIVQQVEFDVAVTAIEGTSTRGGIGVVLGPLALGSQGSSAAHSSSVNRVKFTVPVTFPIREMEEAPDPGLDT